MTLIVTVNDAEERFTSTDLEFWSILSLQEFSFDSGTAAGYQTIW